MATERVRVPAVMHLAVALQPLPADGRSVVHRVPDLSKAVRIGADGAFATVPHERLAQVLLRARTDG